jgi:hypothetical protein
MANTKELSVEDKLKAIYNWIDSRRIDERNAEVNYL